MSGAGWTDALLGDLAEQLATHPAFEALVAARVERALAERGRDNGRQWYTVAEAAERLGCSSDAVRMRVKRGRLEHRRQGRTLYVSADAVDRLA